MTGVAEPECLGRLDARQHPASEVLFALGFRLSRWWCTSCLDPRRSGAKIFEVHQLDYSAGVIMVRLYLSDSMATLGILGRRHGVTRFLKRWA